LEVFENERVWEALQPKIRCLASALASLKDLAGVKEIRQRGFIAGIELQNSTQIDGASMAAAVCVEARQHGLLTRPIQNVIVLMPPLYITTAQLTLAVDALRVSITDVFRHANLCTNAEKVTA
jgi:adenosylmethionine-8-amino-7-oxononanoate aminotransferase